MSFWLALAALAALGVALLVLPLRRGRADDDAAAADDQLRRLEELSGDVAAGDVDPALAPAVRADIERAVVDALPPDTPAATTIRGRYDGVLLAGVCLLVPLLALGVYLKLGSPGLAEFAVAHPALDLRRPEASVEFLLQRVRDRVAAAPDDADAWEILARVELQRGRYPQAIAAAERLQELAPDEPAVLLLLADALIMSGQAEHEHRARALLARALELAPDEPTALVLQGMFHERDGDATAAVASWRRALAHIPAELPLHGELRAMIARTEGRSAGATAGGDVASAPRIRLRAKVTLDAALRARVAPDDTVFVFARAVDGPPMPLAVTRHTVAELPLEVTLDDTMAMAPGASLADATTVHLIARVSRDGTAPAAPGDLEGHSAAIAVSDGAAADVVIDHVIE